MLIKKFIKLCLPIIMIGCLIGGLCLYPLSAQQPAEPSTRQSAQQPTTKVIEIVHADITEYSARIDSNAYRLKGNVEFYHEGVTMYCDSAWWYRNLNAMDAFGNIIISKPEGDGQVVITGDFLRYQGNLREAEIWQNVILTDKDANMTTDHLYYDMNTDICYFLTGAHITNAQNTLYSIRGHFHRRIRKFFFKQEVEMHSPDYDIFTDTLNYNVEVNTAEFVGPTYVTSNQKDSIFCERGWYNTNDTVAFFHQEAWMKSGSNTIYADTLYFDKVSGFGEAFSQVNILDTVNHILIKGEYAYYDNRKDYSYVTDSTCMIMTHQTDSLFLHGDTLYSAVDTLGIRTVLAYNQVRFFSADLQGKCDSMSYTFADSTIRLYFDPVVWGQNNQMSAELIEMLTQNNKVQQLNLTRGAFIASPDSLGYNQLKGRNISGYFKDDNYLYKIVSSDEAEAIFFAKDGLDYIGMNRASSKNIRILLTIDRQIDEVMFLESPKGKLYPIDKLPAQEECQLSGFVWRQDIRPISKLDIYPRGNAQENTSGNSRRKSVMVDGLISIEDDDAPNTEAPNAQ